MNTIFIFIIGILSTFIQDLYVRRAKRSFSTSLGKKISSLSKTFFLYIPDYRIIFSCKNYYCESGYIVL